MDQLLNRLAFFICLIGLLLWGALLTTKYYLFGYYDWDFALAAQTMWNLSHGSTYVSLYGASFLANHAELFAFLLAPVYRIFSHPLTLIYLKLLTFFGGAFVFYHWARRRIHPGLALAVMALFLIHPANIFMLLYEFHFESLSVLFIFLMFYFYDREQFPAFIISAVLLASLKENMPLVVFMFGVYGLIFKKEDRVRWGIVPVALGLAIFLFDVGYLIPHVRKNFTNETNLYWYMFSQFGATPQEALAQGFSKPLSIVQKIWNAPNINYISNLFFPAHLPALFSLHTLMLAAPVLAQNVLSNALSFKTIYYHFQSSIIPILFISTVCTFSFWLPRLRKTTRVILISYFVFFSLVTLYQNWPLISQRVRDWKDAYDPVRERFVEAIPPDAGVVTSFETLHSLSQRKHAYAFLSFWRDVEYGSRLSPMRNTARIEYAVLNLNDPWLMGELLEDPLRISQNLLTFFRQEDWRVKAQVDDLVLMQKGRQDLPKLFEAIAADPNGQNVEVSIDENMALRSVRIKPSEEKNVLIVNFTWQTRQGSNKLYGVALELWDKKSGKRVYYKDRLIGFALQPALLWKEGGALQDRYAYQIRDVAAGEYEMALLFFELTSTVEIVPLNVHRLGTITIH